MLKWILNKGLKFQIILVLFLALSVPVAFVVWNVLVPSKMSDAVRSMQEVKSKNLLEYIDETIDKKQISNINNMENTESIISSNFQPLSRIVRDTRIGIYLSTNKGIREPYNVDSIFQKKQKKITKADFMSDVSCKVIV